MKLLAIFVFISTLLNPSLTEGATAVGKAPSNISNPAQAKILAKRAAQVIALRDNGGKLPQFISETWTPSTGEYIIKY